MRKLSFAVCCLLAAPFLASAGPLKPEYDEFEDVTSLITPVVRLKTLSGSGEHRLGLISTWKGRSRNSKPATVAIVFISHSKTGLYTTTDMDGKRDIDVSEVKFAADDDRFGIEAAHYSRSADFDRDLPIQETITGRMFSDHIAKFCMAKSQKIKIGSEVVEIGPEGARVMRQFLRSVEVLPPIPPRPVIPLFEDLPKAKPLIAEVDTAKKALADEAPAATRRVDELPEMKTLYADLQTAADERDRSTGLEKLDATTKWRKLKAAIDARKQQLFDEDPVRLDLLQKVADAEKRLKDASRPYNQDRYRKISAWNDLYEDELPYTVVR